MSGISRRGLLSLGALLAGGALVTRAASAESTLAQAASLGQIREQPDGETEQELRELHKYGAALLQLESKLPFDAQLPRPVAATFPPGAVPDNFYGTRFTSSRAAPYLQLAAPVMPRIAHELARGAGFAPFTTGVLRHTVIGCWPVDVQIVPAGEETPPGFGHSRITVPRVVFDVDDNFNQRAIAHMLLAWAEGLTNELHAQVTHFRERAAALHAPTVIKTTVTAQLPTVWVKRDAYLLDCTAWLPTYGKAERDA